MNASQEQSNHWVKWYQFLASFAKNKITGYAITLGLLINLADKMDKKCKVFQKKILCENPLSLNALKEVCCRG